MDLGTKLQHLLVIAIPLVFFVISFLVLDRIQKNKKDSQK